MIPLLYNHEAKFPIINNNIVLLLPFLLHACCRFYCIIVAILYVSLLADFTVFVLSDYKRDSIACLVPYTPALGLSGHYSPKEKKQGS